MREDGSPEAGAIGVPTAVVKLAAARSRMLAAGRLFAAAACALAVFVATAAPARADIVGTVRGTLTGADRKPIAHVTVTTFPTQFESGAGRLPAHWIANASFGRTPDRASRALGWALDLDNLFDHRYLIKMNNGFNTTQWNAPRRIVLRVSAPW